MVTFELDLNQRASICQGRKRGEDVQVEGMAKAETWRTTGKDPHKVPSMPERSWKWNRAAGLSHVFKGLIGQVRRLSLFLKETGSRGRS